MRIFVVLHKASKKGGAVLQILKIFKQIKKMGNEIYIFSMNDYSGSKNPLKNFLQISRRLKRLIKEFQPDIIFTAEPFFSAIIAIYANKDNLPIVLRIGAVYDDFYASKIKEKLVIVKYNGFIYRLIKSILKAVSYFVFKRLNVIIFNSYFLKNIYSTITPNSVVIYNGVEIFDITPRKMQNEIKLVYLGRIEPRKSLECILEAINILKNCKVKFSLSLIGDISLDSKYWEKLKIYINENNLEKYINIHGYIESGKLPILLQKHDVLLFPTDDRNFPITEGLPNAILEGMANGLIIVSTKIAGVPEILNSNCGFMVNPSHKEFAEAIENLFINSEKAYKMKLNNLEHVKQKFGIKRSAQEYIKLFTKLLKEK